MLLVENCQYTNLDDLRMQTLLCQMIAEIDDDDYDVGFGQHRMRITQERVGVMLLFERIHDSRRVEEDQLSVTDGGNGQCLVQRRVHSFRNAEGLNFLNVISCTTSFSIHTFNIHCDQSESMNVF